MINAQSVYCSADHGVLLDCKTYKIAFFKALLNLQMVFDRH